MSDAKKITFYDVLGVPESASEADIKAAYRKLVKKAHPDAGGSDAQMHRLTKAYDVLTDKERRIRYNQTLADHRARQEAPKQEVKQPRQPTAQELILEEKKMVADVKSTALKSLFKGVGIALLGFIITAIGYNSAGDGGSYTVFWGLVIWGAIVIIRAWYMYLTPYSTLHGILDTATHRYEFLLEKKGRQGRAIFIILLTIVVGGLILGSIASSGSSTSSSTPVYYGTENSDTLETTYDQCVADFKSAQVELDDINSSMETYDASDDIDSYNALVPRQNSLTESQNAKAAECEQNRLDYNASLTQQ